MKSIKVLHVCVLTIRGSWVKWRGLFLGNFLYFPIELTGGGLVEADCVSQTAGLHSIQQPKCTHPINICGVLSQVKGDLANAKRVCIRLHAKVYK